jgi:hypothetical protein
MCGVTIESPIESPMVSPTILNSSGSRVRDRPYRGYLYPPKTNYISRLKWPGTTTMGLINCGTSDSPTSTNLSINLGDYLPWPVLVTLSRWEPNPIQYKLSNRLLSRSRSVGSERVNLGGSVQREQTQHQVHQRVKDPSVRFGKDENRIPLPFLRMDGPPTNRVVWPS